MITSKKLLPTEVAALVHHIELNRAGWWEKAMQRLVMAAVWLSDRSPTVGDIHNILDEEFHLVLSESQINNAIAVLESQNSLIRLEGTTFRIPESRRTAFETEIEGAETCTANARQSFCSLLLECCPKLNPESTWVVFETTFLTPLIKEVGANAYHLIAGEPLIADKMFVSRFMKQFDANLHSSLNDLVSRFLDPKNDAVRMYVSRMLHATFCVKASGLSENVIQKLNTSNGKQIVFRVFVDTNFLFSILELHDNPSNDAARELQELIRSLKGNPSVDLYVTPLTIEEAKHSLALAKLRLAGIRGGMNFTNAALRAGFSGMDERFLEERSCRAGKLSVEDWFDPYLNNFVSIAKSKGVALFNEKLDSYTMRQDVIDDIALVMKLEERRTSRRKTYEMVRHDMVLWHLVNDRRPAYIESPIDATDWILTIDFRLIGFDEHKQRHMSSKVPTCLHPTSLIQLLQFWVPRTKDFEEAILSSMRLPFLFQEFDADAERTSLRILKGIGRFEESENLSEEAITDVVLNEGLRARINSDQNEATDTKLIRDALLEEMKKKSETDRKLAEELVAANRAQEEKLSALHEVTQGKDNEIEQLKARVAEEEKKAREATSRIQTQESRISDEETKTRQAEGRIQTQGQEIENLKAIWAQREAAEIRRRALNRYWSLLAAAVAITGLATWLLAGLLSQLSFFMGVWETRILVALVMFVLCHLCIEKWAGRTAPMNQLWPFQQISKLRSCLWTLVILSLIIGVVGNLVANRIQRNLDTQTNSSFNPKTIEK